VVTQIIPQHASHMHIYLQKHALVHIWHFTSPYRPRL